MYLSLLIAVMFQKEKRYPDRAPLWLLQTMLLNCIGLIYSGGERAKASGLSSFAELVNFSNKERLLWASSKSKAMSTNTSPEPKWMRWIEDEVRRRIGYCIWVS